MTDSPAIWKQINWYVEPDFQDEPVRSCFLSKVFHYWSGRNAYWGSWSTESPGFASYALDSELLKKRIEGERVQGSHFNIAEIPAIVLMGLKHDLMLIDSSNTPFKDVPLESVAGGTLKTLAKSIQTHTSWRGNTFLMSFGQSRRPILPFKVYDSYPQGPGLRLGWSEKRQSVDISHILALISHNCSQLQAEG